MHDDKLTCVVVNALDEIKASDIVVLDVTRLTSLFDKVIVATAESSRQTRALARNIQEKARAAGGLVHGVEGETSGEWVLVDFGDLVVHIMQAAARDHYNLEELWGGHRSKLRQAPSLTSGFPPPPVTAH
jgi:ribosome-associated protein